MKSASTKLVLCEKMCCVWYLNAVAMKPLWTELRPSSLFQFTSFIPLDAPEEMTVP